MYSLDKDELEQIRRIAEWRASLSFDASKGCSFAGYVRIKERELCQRERRKKAPVSCTWRQPKVRHQITTEEKPLEAYVPSVASSAELQAEFYGALNYLDQSHREVIEATLRGESTWEISESMGVHIFQVEYLISNSIIELRKVIGIDTGAAAEFGVESGFCVCGKAIAAQNESRACADCGAYKKHRTQQQQLVLFDLKGIK